MLCGLTTDNASQHSSNMGAIFIPQHDMIASISLIIGCTVFVCRDLAARNCLVSKDGVVKISGSFAGIWQPGTAWLVRMEL